VPFGFFFFRRNITRGVLGSPTLFPPTGRLPSIWLLFFFPEGMQAQRTRASAPRHPLPATGTPSLFFHCDVTLLLQTLGRVSPRHGVLFPFHPDPYAFNVLQRDPPLSLRWRSLVFISSRPKAKPESIPVGAPPKTSGPEVLPWSHSFLGMGGSRHERSLLRHFLRACLFPFSSGKSSQRWSTSHRSPRGHHFGTLFPPPFSYPPPMQAPHLSFLRSPGIPSKAGGFPPEIRLVFSSFPLKGGDVDGFFHQTPVYFFPKDNVRPFFFLTDHGPSLGPYWIARSPIDLLTRRQSAFPCFEYFSRGIFPFRFFYRTFVVAGTPWLRPFPPDGPFPRRIFPPFFLL